MQRAEELGLNCAGLSVELSLSNNQGNCPELPRPILLT